MNINIEDVLRRMNISALNKMQLEILEKAGAENDSKNDVVLLSPTGSGKTLGFLLPLLLSLNENEEFPQAMIIAPSRELALQIESVFKSMGTGFKVCCCYGGHSFAVERRSLSYPTSILVGTPGRLLEHLEKETTDFSHIKTLVLDEFDKSLEFGFEREMSEIVFNLGSVERKFLTSATFAVDIPSFVKMNKPIVLDYLPEEDANNDKLVVRRVISPSKDKLETLVSLLCNIESGASVLVFCNFRESVERTGKFLSENGIHNATFHGGMEQDDREKALSEFRNGSTNVFVSTDLAARGLDISGINYIVHYHLPKQEEEFIHRNGRTARMHASGVSYVIISHEEELPVYLEDYKEVQKLSENTAVPELPMWQTLYIGKGKKNKVNKIDVLGFLCQVGGLSKDEVGFIDVKDYHIYVAISREKALDLYDRIKGQKLKGWRAKFELC